MTESSQSKTRTTSEPIINLVDDEKAKSITWEIADGIFTEDDKNLLINEKQKDVVIRTENDDKPEQEEEQEEDTFPQEQEQEEKEEESDNDKQEEEVKKRSRNVPRDKRISSITKEKNQFKSLYEDTLYEKKNLEHRLHLTEQQSLENYERTLSANIDNIKRALISAKEEGDYNTEVEASDLLAQYSAEKLRVSQEKQRYQNISRQPTPQRPDPQNHHQNDEIDETYRANAMDWVKRNSWADRNSSNFDNEMLDEAADYEVRLAKTYKLQGKGDEIGTEDFWNQITNHVHEEFSVPLPQKTQPKQERLTMNPQNSTVTPVTRTNIPSNSPRKSSPPPLSDLEKQYAHGLWGKIRDDKGRIIRDFKQCEVVYQKMKLQQK